WRNIWRWEGPQRIHQFLWLAAHRRLLTNAEQRRRHLKSSEECGGCLTGVETSIHIIRDCPTIKEVWCELLDINDSHPFFHIAEEEWCRRYVADSNWSLRFDITCWVLWKNQNERVF
ncbi:Putative ribonuclease H protein At1g65750, partial [Linum perenne]